MNNNKNHPHPSGRLRYVALLDSPPPRIPRRLAMQAPRLPWEVIERVIAHARECPETLHHFSLTCHQLCPHSRSMLFARVSLKSRVDVFAFVDFIQDNPQLNSFVHSIVVQPNDFAPFPLLHVLTNLSEIRFTARTGYPPSRGDIVVAPHQSSLACFQRFGTRIRDLHLCDLSFSTSMAFAQFLLALTDITHLVCMDIAIQMQNNQAPLGGIKRRLSERLRLKSLIVSVCAYFSKIWLRTLSGQIPITD